MSPVTIACGVVVAFILGAVLSAATGLDLGIALCLSFAACVLFAAANGGFTSRG